nr:immunoglobulin heavy chain junction region [Mus musculus]MBK4189753.1 immunoglobulin heavy chain junction region [Mus musculus]
CTTRYYYAMDYW